MGRLHELEPAECRELLGGRQVGRLAFSTPAGPRVYPVNYVLRDDDLVFRTLPYGEVAGNVVDAQVAFSVDDLDDGMRTGWHVLAVGTCRRVDDPAEVRVIREESPPAPWVDGQRTLYFRLAWDELTGRRVQPD